METDTEYNTVHGQRITLCWEV